LLSVIAQITTLWKRERVMRVTIFRSLILVALTMGIAPAAIAQGKPASEAVTQAIKAAHEKFTDAWNKHDAAGIAALCTADRVFVTPTGIAVGRREIENSYKKLFAQIAAKGFVEPVDQVQTLSGNTAIAFGHWTLQSPSARGYWTEVYELQGQDWNIRLHAHNITPVAVPAR
jgi:uncharacterized protein (TIGR02246 family)